MKGLSSHWLILFLNIHNRINLTLFHIHFASICHGFSRYFVEISYLIHWLSANFRHRILKFYKTGKIEE